MHFATFRLAYLRFTPLRESSYLPLYDDIIEFVAMRDIIVLREFNPQDELTTMLNRGQVMYGEAMGEEVGLTQQARCE